MVKPFFLKIIKAIAIIAIIIIIYILILVIDLGIKNIIEFYIFKKLNIK